MTEDIKYQIARSKRRTIVIQISGTDVIVKAPHFVPEFVIKKFVLGKKDWIVRHINRNKQNNPPVSRNFSQGDKYPYLGHDYALNYGAFHNISTTDKLNFPLALKFRVQKELTDFYIKEAKRIILQRAEYFKSVMHVDFKDIRFSDTGSKWGTCMHDNSLQFSWRLIMAPLLVIDYVVVHELAHTKFKNHGRTFWNEVKKYKPAYKQYIKWLRDNSERLHQVV